MRKVKKAGAARTTAGARSTRTKPTAGKRVKTQEKASRAVRAKGTTGKKPATASKTTNGAKTTKTTKSRVAKGRAKTTSTKKVSAKNARVARSLPPAEEIFRIRELDPQQKCGPATSVEELYRVDELVGNGRTAHLVFLDRHGWYCVHGRNCPAVGPARTFGDRARRNGPTHNGRMRA